MTEHCFTRSEVITALESSLLSTHTQQTILKALDPSPYNPPVGSVYAWVNQEGITLYAQCFEKKSSSGYVTTVRPLSTTEVPALAILIHAVGQIANTNDGTRATGLENCNRIAAKVMKDIENMYETGMNQPEFNQKNDTLLDKFNEERSP